MNAPEAPRILIVRMSAIGDTILTLPVACALRAACPQAHLAWAVEPAAAPMVLGHECLDEVIVLPRGWFTSPAGLRAAWRQLQPRRFDVALDCQGMTKSGLACWLSGARRRIGFRGEHARELSGWFHTVRVANRMPHITDRSLELLEPLGIRSPRIEWRLPIDFPTRQRADEALAAVGLPERFAVINPGATWGSKRWDVERFAAVARHLSHTAGLVSLVVWGGSAEREWAAAIVAAADRAAVSAPPTSLLELAALIQRARIFISADTGPLHMAVAVGTPSIGLYGPTRPRDCGPYGRPHIALQVEYQAGSRRERRRAENRAMMRITAEMVCLAADRLLAATASRDHRAA